MAPFVPRALVVGLLCGLALAATARANTFVVTKTADTNDGACDSDCSLREAIIAANANPGADVITLPAGTYTLTIPGTGENAGATGDLDITGDLTINGAGAATTIVDGGALDRVFEVVSSVTVAFNNLTIRGGALTGGNGGGILNDFGTVTITNCTISANSVPNGDGGGVYNDAVMTITGSTISGNSASNGDGGGVYDNGNSLTVTGATISGNSASNGDGGGIYENGNSLTIADSTISGNSVPGGDGGGLYTNGIAAAISGSTFSGNSASGGDGGGIYHNGSGLTMTNCTVSGNDAVDGGGFFNNGVSVNITNATIASNSATSTGGGIDNFGEAPSLTSTIVANSLSGGNCSGTITDGGTNLQFPGTTCGASIASADPVLGPLANNGGPTQTHALLAGSAAIDAGTEICPPTPPIDQRGVARPQGPACDIGSFELQVGAATPTPTPPGATATPTATPAGVPTPTVTPVPPPAAAIPTLSWPIFGLLGLALAAVALSLLMKQR